MYTVARELCKNHTKVCLVIHNQSRGIHYRAVTPSRDFCDLSPLDPVLLRCNASFLLTNGNNRRFVPFGYCITSAQPFDLPHRDLSSSLHEIIFAHRIHERPLSRSMFLMDLCNLEFPVPCQGTYINRALIKLSISGNSLS